MIRLRSIRASEATLVLVIVVWTVFGSWLAPYNPYQALATQRLLPPDAANLFGTDDNGFDILSRILAAGRVDVGVALTATIISMLSGSALGLLVAQWELSRSRGLRLIARFVLSVTEIMQAFPVFILAMILVAAFGANALNLILAIAFVNAPVFLRLVRAEAVSLWKMQFAEAARITGNRDIGISFRHILPNALPTIITQISVTIGFGILLTAGLSFVGAGIKPPTPELGGMIAAGGRYVISGQWWVSVFPGLALAFLIFSFAYLGDRLRAASQVKGRRSHLAAVAALADAPITKPAKTKPRLMPVTVHGAAAQFSVSDLNVSSVESGETLLRHVSFALGEGEAASVVGPSLAGKSLLIRALLGIYDRRSLKVSGTMTATGHAAISLAGSGSDVRFAIGVCGLVANPRLMLNPVVKLRAYFDRVLAARGFSKADARAESARLLTAVGISDAAVRLNQYPFQLSGGTAQRVCIALTLAAGAKTLCLDEPTAGLDVTIQRQVLELIMQLRREFGLSVIFATSDLALAGAFSDTMVVLDKGELVEQATPRQILAAPATQTARRLVEVSRI